MKSPYKIAVLLSGSGTNLQAIIDAIDTHHYDYEITTVVSNVAGAYGLKRAKQANIPTHTVDNHDFSDRNAFESALLDTLEPYQPQLIVLAGFMRIFTGHFIENYPGKIINLHPSLLPKYKGMHTYEKALAAGEKEHGSTIHFVTEALDSGPNILQAVVPIQNEETVESLKTKVQAQEHIYYPRVIQWFSENRIYMRDNAAYLDDKVLPPQGIQEWTSN